MYEQEPWKQRQRLQEEEAAEVRELVAYLSHVNKPGHLKTVMRLVDGLARIESSVSWLSEEHNIKKNKQNIGGDFKQEYPPFKPQIIELPQGTRKVSIEL